MIFLAIKFSTTAATQSCLAALIWRAEEPTCTWAAPSRKPNMLFLGYVAISMLTLHETIVADPLAWVVSLTSVPST